MVAISRGPVALDNGTGSMHYGTIAGTLNETFSATVQSREYQYYFTLSSLPVELVKFQANTIDDEQVELIWETATEENNDGFEVQRSTDGKNWEKIDFIQGHGTTLETKNYTLLDENPISGVNYYRLKQVDFDGKYEFSDVINVEVKQLNSQTISFFPNPVQDELNILNGEGDATIYNVLGQPVRTLIINTEQYSINTRDLSKGQYILSIQQENGKVITTRFVK